LWWSGGRDINMVPDIRRKKLKKKNELCAKFRHQPIIEKE